MTRIALFAEGGDAPDARGLGAEFVQLWHTLLARAGIGGTLAIEGFHKGHLVSMDPRFRHYLPLDEHITRVHERRSFDILVVAFDREPKHNGLQRACRREEVDLLLSGLAQSTVLPPVFARAAAALRAHYAIQPPPEPRVAGRPPRLVVDVVCMEPCFEGVLLEDEAGVREALGLKGKRVREWPKWDRRTARPDLKVLAPAVACAAPEVRRIMRKPFDQDKHGWARFLIERLPGDSPVFADAFVQRLQTVLA